MATKSNRGSSAHTELTLLDARSTLSPEEALRYLCLRTNVSLASDTVWSHALEGRIPLTIEFHVAAHGRRGCVMPRTDDHVVVDPPGCFTRTRDPMVPEVRRFGVDRVVEIQAGWPQRLCGQFDLCRAGDWQIIIRQFRRGEPRFLDEIDMDLGGLADVFVTHLDAPTDVIWELCDVDARPTRDYLHSARPVFRREALDQFLTSFVGTVDDSEYKGELSITTLAQMLGALIAADGTRKKVLADLLDTNIRGFGQRNLDKYLAFATDEFEKARAGVKPEKRR